MKRFFLGLIVLSFFSFIGLQTTHLHAKAPLETCQICVLSAHTLRHLPATSPTVAPSVSWTYLCKKPETKHQTRHYFDSSARAPPED